MPALHVCHVAPLDWHRDAHGNHVPIGVVGRVSEILLSVQRRQHPLIVNNIQIKFGAVERLIDFSVGRKRLLDLVSLPKVK
mmetsp:Transcript_22459/g.27683  ORF Transcript_22459/g.27683 Transcript_22459/m.27683 type:complete len:81 (+) Transcript_22459:2034-2276(+)